MGLREDVKKLKEKYDFLRKEENCQLIEIMTKGYVSKEMLIKMNSKLEALEKAAEMNLPPEQQKAVEDVSNKLQKGFIDAAYEQYVKDYPKMSKDEYFDAVVELIETYTDDNVVKSDFWSKIYRTALAERTEYSNEKYMNFIDKTEQINDMYKRYTEAKSKYEDVVKNQENRNQRELFRKDYPDGKLQDLDEDIKRIGESEEYANAKQKVEDFNLANKKATEAVNAYNVADAEYKTLFENKTNELAQKNGYTVEQFKQEYNAYPKKEEKLKEALALQEELKSLQEEFIAAKNQLPIMEDAISKKTKEVNELDTAKRNLTERYVKDYTNKAWPGTLAKKNDLNKVHKDRIKNAKKTGESIDAINNEFKALQDNLDKKYQEGIQDYQEHELREKLDFKNAETKYNDAVEAKTTLETAKNQFQKVVDTFNTKLREYYTHLTKNQLINTTDAGIDLAQVYNPAYSETLQEKTLNVDLKGELAKFNPFHELDETTKDAKAKVDELDTKQKDAQAERAEKAVPEESTKLLENYDKKLAMQKEMHTYSDVAGELYKVETELVSKDYHMEKPDLFTEIIKSANEFWSKRDLRRGNHENTTEFKNMIESVERLKDYKEKDLTGLRTLLAGIANSTEVYLSAKKDQWRIVPSALRRTRMEAAQDLLDKVTKHLNTIEEVNKKYEAIEKNTLDRMQQLEGFQKKPVFKAHQPVEQNAKDVSRVVDNAEKNMEVNQAIM